MRFIPAVSRVRIPLSLSKKSLVNVDFTGLFCFAFFHFRPFQTVSFVVKSVVKKDKKVWSNFLVIYAFVVKIVVRKFELFFSRKSPFFITYNSQITTFYEFLDENANFKGILNYTSIYILNYMLY